MKQLIVTEPGQRGLTPEGMQAFQWAYQSVCIFEKSNGPVIAFPGQAANYIREISKLRMKQWQTTSRWNAAADETGLLGELAAQVYLGISADQAMAEFLQGLAGGDRGVDIIAQGLKLDVKTTKGLDLKFKFNPRNRFSHLAEGFLFAYLEEIGFQEAWVHLFGWSYRADVKPYMRKDGHRLFVRATTLSRAGVLQSVSKLKKTSNVVTFIAKK